MRLISWNANGRVAATRDQVEALRERQPDTVALQEVRRTALDCLKTELSKIGLLHSVDSSSLAANSAVLVGPRQYGELIACRWPLSALPPTDFRIPWPERVLSAHLDSPSGRIEIHTTYIPVGESNGWTNTETFEGIFERLACASIHPRILCGDFNSPQKELSDGTIVTWGQEILGSGEIVMDGTWRDRTGREDTLLRLDIGERNVLEALARFDLPDVFRSLHGYQVQEFSWYWKSGERRIGRRFDHIFASPQLNAVRCQYIHSFREMGLSDHSPIEADFELPRMISVA